MESNIAMNGGDGPESYVYNSSYQGSGAATSLAMIEEAIAADLDNMANFPTISTSGEPFRIADLGCSVGPNTFVIVRGIIKMISKFQYYKYCKTTHVGYNSPEFQVFFNDSASNDYNTLVRSPLWRPDSGYFAAAVPGSFHRRLFPASSIHFIHSSYAIHWLSRLPNDVMDEKSPAWNKGKITSFLGARPEVVEAFRDQFAMDMDCFLRAREEEVVAGGVMAFVFPFRRAAAHDHADSPHHHQQQQPLILLLFDFLESALSDMVATGRLNEYKVDSFNLNIFMPTMEEFNTLVARNGSFAIEKMQPLTSSFQMEAFDAGALSTILRAGTEWAMSTHFGAEIVDEIFLRHAKKIEESSDLVRSCMGLRMDLFVLLKRKPS